VRKIETLLFDLDGVLIDSLDDAVDCLNYTFLALGLKEKGRSEIQTYLGPGDTHLVLQGIGEENSHLLDQALMLYRERYKEMCVNKTALCPGVEEVLHYFRDKNMAVITNKPEAMARYVLEKLKAAHFFKFIWGPESVKNKNRTLKR
jgi:phosphoglycolate phosphatase